MKGEINENKEIDTILVSILIFNKIIGFFKNKNWMHQNDFLLLIEEAKNEQKQNKISNNK